MASATATELLSRPVRMPVSILRLACRKARSPSEPNCFSALLATPRRYSPWMPVSSSTWTGSGGAVRYPAEVRGSATLANRAAASSITESRLQNANRTNDRPTADES